MAIDKFSDIPGLLQYINGGELDTITYKSGSSGLISQIDSTGRTPENDADVVTAWTHLGGDNLDVFHDKDNAAYKIGELPAFYIGPSATSAAFTHSPAAGEDIRNTSLTVFFLAEIEEALNNEVIDATFGTGAHFISYQARTTGNEYWYVANTAMNTGTAQVVGSPIVRGLTWSRATDGGDGNAYAYVDATSVYGRDDRTQTNDITLFSIFDARLGDNPMTGKFGIYVVYSRVLTQEEITDVVGLMEHWRDNGEAPVEPPQEVETSHTFGPVRPSDASATVSWECSRTAYEPTGVFVSASNMTHSTERKTGEDYFLDVNSVQSFDAGKVRARATTAYSTIVSKESEIIASSDEVEPPEPPPGGQGIVITQQPQDVAVMRPGPATFTVAATHSDGHELFYHWPKANRLTFYNDREDRVGNTPTYHCPKTYAEDNDYYTNVICRIRWGSPDNTEGEVYTDPAKVVHTYGKPTMVQDLQSSVNVVDGSRLELECEGSFPLEWGEVYYVWEASRDGIEWHRPDHILNSVDIQSTTSKKLIIDRVSTDARDATLIYPEHMTHEGTWEITGGDYLSQRDPKYGGHNMALHPDGDKLYFGHRCYNNQKYSHVSIVNIPADFATPVDIDTDGVELQGDIGAGSAGEHRYRGGFAWNNRYIYTKIDWYDTTPTTGLSHNTCDLDLTNFGNMTCADYRGHNLSKSFTNGYMWEVPDERKAEVGKPCMLGNMMMGNYGSNVTGISICAFDPDAIDTTTPDDPANPTKPFAIEPCCYHTYAKPLVKDDWPCLYPRDGGISLQPPPNRLATKSTDLALGAFWPANTNSILFIGRKGLGEFEYKVKNTEWGHPGGGDGAGPYTLQVYAYDAREVLSAKSAGEATGDYPTVYPYAVWDMPVGAATKAWIGQQFFRQSEAGALAWDESRRRLYWCHGYEVGDPELHACQIATL